MARVLIISSQVVAGTIGGSIAAKVFAKAGHEIMHLPTTVLAHYPGHPNNPGVKAGQTTSADALDDMITALENAGYLESLDLLFAGYVVEAGQWRSVLRAKAASKAPLFLAPAFGDDHTGPFVDPSVFAALGEVLKHATWASLNRWEYDKLLDQGDRLPKHYLITSWEDSSTHIGTRLVSANESRECRHERLAAEWPIHGMGDLVAAITALGLLEQHELLEAGEAALDQAQTILQRSLDGHSPDLLI